MLSNDSILFGDQKIFRYRYDFQPKNLLEFISERYADKVKNASQRISLLDRILLNGQSVSEQTTIQKGDWIEYTHLRSDEASVTISPDILYEDDDLLAISKPDFLPVIPNTKYYFTSMAIWMKERYKSDDISPVHRLDIETSGVLLFGKSKRARADTQRLFQNKLIDKRYQAIVFNKPSVKTIQGDLSPDQNSKIYTKQKLSASTTPSSVTNILRSQPWGKYHRVWVQPITGKTNQIRVHLAEVNCPIVGDKKYYPDEAVFLDWFQHRDIDRIIDRLILPRQALRCESMRFIHPYSQEEVLICDTHQSWDTKIEQLLSD